MGDQLRLSGVDQIALLEGRQNFNRRGFALQSTLRMSVPTTGSESLNNSWIDLSSSGGSEPNLDNNNADFIKRTKDEIVEAGQKIVHESRQELAKSLTKLKGYLRSSAPGINRIATAPPPTNALQKGPHKAEPSQGVSFLHKSQSSPNGQVLFRDDQDTLISAISQVFHQSKRITEGSTSAWGNVVQAVHVASQPNEYYDQSDNQTLMWEPPPIPLDLLSKYMGKGLGDSDTNLMFKMALGVGAWELVYMYQRSLLGPTIQTFLNKIPLAAYLKPVPNIALPQNDQDQIAERHRIQEITQIQYNYTGLAKFGGYFGEPLIGGPAMFNHVPPSNNLFLVSEADSLQVQLGFNINFIRNATVSKLKSALGGFYTKSKFTSLEDYAEAIKFFKVTPPIVKNNQSNLSNWLNDAEFGRQRLQGLNPEMLQKVQSLDQWKNVLLAKLTWTQTVDTAVTKLLGGVNITDAIKQGIVYFVDFSVMDNDTLRTLAMSFNRYIAAPVALFFYNTSTKGMMPLGIQLMPNTNQPGHNQFQFHLPTQVNGVDTPAWLLAKIWVNSVDGQYQEIVSHLMETHQISELFAVAFFRNLAVNHPVNQLLRSHFEATLEINSIAYGDLLSYNGAINQTIGAGSIGGAIVITQLWPTWNFFQKSLKQSLINRGFLNPDGKTPADNIQGYYWRDDGLQLWNIINNFVQSVLDGYYQTDADVVNDWEIQNWINELQGQRGGQLKGATQSGTMTTKQDLYTMCTNIIFTVCAKHSAGNSGQFDYYGWTPNVPGALYIPPTINEQNTTWNTIFQALPPKEPSLNQMSITYLLSNIQQNDMPMIGNAIYPSDWNNQVNTFRSNLAALSNSIQKRESGKPYPYLYLDPAQVGNSIYI